MTNMWGMSVLVGLGGFAGSMARYGLSVTSQRLSIDWPLGTLAANVIGCLLIGIITAFSVRSGTISPEIRLVLATGFCGGFTTMSTMICETAQMLKTSEYLYALKYVAGTFIFSMAAFAIGVLVVQQLLKLWGGVESP